MYVDRISLLSKPNRVDDEHLVKGPTALRLLWFRSKLIVVGIMLRTISHSSDWRSLGLSFNTGKTVLAEVSEIISEIAGYIHVI